MVLLGTGAELFGPAQATAAMGAIATVLVLITLIAIPSLRRVEVTAEKQALESVEKQETSPTPTA